MKLLPLFCVLAGLWFSGIARGDVVFSTLTATNTYDGGRGPSITGSGTFFGTYQGMADSFSPTLSGTLLSIDFGVFRAPGTDGLLDVNLTLSDPSHLIPLAGSLVSGTINSVFGGSDNSALTTFTPTGAPVSLVAGQVYWITMTPHTSGTFAAWALSLAADASHSGSYHTARTSNGTTWVSNSTAAFDPVLAFRVNAAVSVSSVPEPGSAGVLAACCLGAVALFSRTTRRRVKSEIRNPKPLPCPSTPPSTPC